VNNVCLIVSIKSVYQVGKPGLLFTPQPAFYAPAGFVRKIWGTFYPFPVKLSGSYPYFPNLTLLSYSLRSKFGPMRVFLLLFLFQGFLKGYVSAQRVAAQRPVTLFTVRAVDEKSNQEVPASFKIFLHTANKRFEGANRIPNEANFYVKMYSSDTVTIETAAEGYFTIEEIMLVSCDTCGFYQYTALMEKQEDSVFTNLKINDVIKLDKIYFDQSKYDLRPESREQLEKLYRTLRDNPGLKIEIAGHTDNVGDARLNQYLSENRARVIYAYLLRKNIASSRLRHQGYGSSKPVAPNDSEDNKSLNRRVEFVVLAN
jgi:OmpA-OmpF porin, OOP family